MMKFIQYEEKDYGVIRLNRPDKHHAISIEMAKELQTLLKEIHTSTIPFLVIEGNGDKSFCAGGDLYEFHGNLTEQEAYDKLSVMKQVLQALVLFPVPVIALLHGNAFGGGCELATACDVRIAKEGTQFGFVQTNLGILPGWGGGAILHKKIAPAQALHWMMAGTIYEAVDVKANGWLQEIIPRKQWENKEALLNKFITKSREQMYLLKKQYMKSLDTGQLFANMEEEVKACASIWESEIHQQHVKTFMNR